VENLQAIIEHVLAGSPFTKAGINTALWDAYARTLDISMAEALGGVRRREIPIKFSLSGDKARIKHVYETATKLGFGAFKLKIGMDPLDDAERFAFTRELVGKETFLGTDANMGFRRSDARLMVNLMRDLNPAFFEQPVAAGDLQGMYELRELGLPIVADESVFRLDDLVAVLRAQATDVVSVYVGKSGGPSKAVQMGMIADAFGIDSIIGSNGESGVGAAAQLQVAAAIPGLSARFPSDIIGEFYYSESVLEQRLDSDGRVARLPDAPGLGVNLKPELVGAFAPVLE
jgi:muconate cycloisomerase